MKDIDSKIFTSVQDIVFLEKRLKKTNVFLTDKKLKLKLLFTTSRDGDSVSTFHSKCDDIKDTLTLVKMTTGFTLGGFTRETMDENKL